MTAHVWHSASLADCGEHYCTTGTLELELGDFVSRHKYRVCAFDHDSFSFVDAKAGEWPLILVTTPKVGVVLPPRYQLADDVDASPLSGCTLLDTI